MEIELECSLCNDIYDQPRTLGCLHSFCLECLYACIENYNSNLCLRCPICRTSFHLESKDQLANLIADSYLLDTLDIHNSLEDSNLQQQIKKQKVMCSDEKNEATHYCLECEEYFCEICVSAHKTMKISKNHQLIPIEEMKDNEQTKSVANLNSNSNSNLNNHCQTHQQETSLFCEDCKLSICSLCVDKHPSHKISNLSTILENEKQSLIDLINQVNFFFSFFFFFFQK